MLQQGAFERVTRTHTVKVKVRVITTTNRDPEEEVAEGKRYEDLFYRLNVMPTHTPALRERLEDHPGAGQVPGGTQQVSPLLCRGEVNFLAYPPGGLVPLQVRRRI